MAKTAAKQQLVKKVWVPILAPKLFNEMLIGESLLADANTAVGRIVTVSMTTLTNDIQRQHINVSFKVTGINKDALVTELVGYHFSPNSVKRFVRRARSKLDDSFTVVTADGKKLRIKPLMVTRSRTKGGVKAALIKGARTFLTNHLAKTKLEAFWTDVIAHNAQKQLSDALRKTYPLNTCEFRWIVVEGEGVPPVVVEETKKETPATDATETTEEVLEEAIADADSVAQ